LNETRRYAGNLPERSKETETEATLTAGGKTMTTIAITLDDELAARLRDEAEVLGVSPEDLARRGVENLLSSSRFDPEFQAALSAVLEENAELYRRLA
jgi:predicted transcriptional regulator